jgi:hypothetical protein
MTNPISVNVFKNGVFINTKPLDLRLKVSVLRSIFSLTDQDVFLTRKGPIAEEDEECMVAKDIICDESSIIICDLDMFENLSESDNDGPDETNNVLKTDHKPPDYLSILINLDHGIEANNICSKGNRGRRRKNVAKNEHIKQRGRKPKVLRTKATSAVNHCNGHVSVGSGDIGSLGLTAPISSRDIALWYSNRENRVPKVSYEINRNRFNSIRNVMDSKMKKKVCLNVESILGKIETSLILNNLRPLVVDYFSQDYQLSQTMYLHCIDGEFIIKEK